ncbi:hypothetical protein GU926_07225 [Nibribacter ruber]|uniref:DUF922 domain-containing protein n=1 Tax=Nibribacter ruber TaxID=2698458 RepID=A0A6P1P149_9BACT|nr:hypothetical protein [Nibribacter ruber]QHL87233.1 hypothetical protein GU926_07225 [Nibribacter ruber]
MIAAGKPSSATIAPIQLRAEKLPFIPNEFHIAEVVDERVSQKTIGTLVPPFTTPALPPAAQTVDFQGGAVLAITTYLQQSLAQNASLRPITLKIKEYQVTETPGDKGKVNGQVAISVAFELRREGKQIHLLDYKSGARYIRSSHQLTVVESTLRKLLNGSLEYLHLWMEREAAGNEKLAKGLQVHITDHLENTEPDTLFYDPNQPLNFSDFKGRRPPNNFAASIFPGLSYESTATMDKGIIHIKIHVKVYALRELTQIQDNARDARTLNHEQRHFDIVKVAAERFKQRIQPQKLTIEDYDSMIQYEYLKALWEIGDEQKKYDADTSHGISSAGQAKWNAYLDEELKKLGVYPSSGLTSSN